MGWGGWYRKRVGSGYAIFLPAAAQVCHDSLELITVSHFWWELLVA